MRERKWLCRGLCLLTAGVLLLGGVLLYRAGQRRGHLVILAEDPGTGRRPASAVRERRDALVPLGVPFHRGELVAALPVRGAGLTRMAPFLVAAPPPPPPAQVSLDKIQKTLERAERLIPATEGLLREYTALAKSLRETVPDLRRTNKELEKLLKNANDTVPLIQDALKEGTVAARNWGRVGERVNVLIGTNEDRINSIIKNLDLALANVADAFNKENRNDLATILRNLSTSSKRLPSITRETEAFLKEGRQTQAKFNDTLKRTDDLLDQLRGAKPGQGGRGPIKDLQEGAAKFNAMMTDVNALMRVVGQSDGTLRRFIADPALYNNLDDAALMVKRIFPRLDRILHDLEVFADKLARHPEALGLGGVVRPSKGLKEPPTPRPFR